MRDAICEGTMYCVATVCRFSCKDLRLLIILDAPYCNHVPMTESKLLFPTRIKPSGS